MSAYDELMAFQRDTEALGQVMGRLGWDMETMMPTGAADQRAEEMAALDGVLHARRTDPRIGGWLDEALVEDAMERRQLDDVQREYDRTRRVPAELSAALTKAGALSHQAWIEARKSNDFKAFSPHLETVLGLAREKGAALADGGDPYDALLQDFEPGATGSKLDAMFAALRPRLVSLRERVDGSTRQVAPLARDFPIDGQLRISEKLARAFGYDLNHGRIDMAVHPFSSGSGLDVRITTRTDPANPADCFYSTIHEVGHACYEQNIDAKMRLTPMGREASMGVHESQSRCYENQLGRSRAFTSHLFELMRSEFGDFGVSSAEEFYAVMNRCHAGYIRTEADEVHYNLHVALRFDLERDLVAGRLIVADLPAAWDARFEADFGIKVDVPANGVLQDVHWSEGLFGYFPTYTLGNVYAGCLHSALRRDIPDLDASLAEGDTSLATGWLRDNVQRHGRLLPAHELITQATGGEPNVESLLDYLDDKFGEIYGV
ncbi:MAG: carboxypeptidase M32 [Boseongicola sp.]